MTRGSIVPATWEVPEIFRRRMGDRVGQQRCMVSEGHLLLILHAPPLPDATEREGRLFWRHPDGTWSTDQTGNGLGALDRHLKEFETRIEELDLDEREAQDPEAYFGVIQALAPIHRSAVNGLNAIQAARESMPEDRDLINYRDRAAEIARTAELVYSEARYGLEFVMAKGAQEHAASATAQAVASHRLNVLAAFFFPIVTLAGLFGVNLQHGLENSTAPFAFLIMIGGGLILGAILKSWVTRAAPPKKTP